MTQPYYRGDDGITIYCGDCRSIPAWTEADVVITDPPFGMNYCSGFQNRRIANDGDTTVRDEALAMMGQRPALVFGRWNCPRPASTKMVLTWDKGEWPGMGDLALPWGPSTEEIYVIGSGFVGKRSGSVIRVDRLNGETTHPNEKPVGLMEHLIMKCPTGWTIADPFMGTGPVLEAAKLLGRRAIGVELDESYCAIAAARISQGVMFGGCA